MQRNPVSQFSIIALLLVIVIDSMAAGLIFPVIGPLFLSKTRGILPYAISMVTRDYLYSLLLASFSLLAFVAAPFLGNWSDQVGRKKILLLCLLGTVVSMFLAGFSILIKNIVLLFIARALGGITAGSQAIAEAIMADVSTKSKKANNMALIMLAMSVGLIVGPIIGSFFSDPHLSQWFNFSTPFFIGAGIALVNALLLLFVFRDTYTPPEKHKLYIFRGLSLVFSAFAQKKVRFLSWLALIMNFGMSLFIADVSIYLIQAFGFKSIDLGYIMIAYSMVLIFSLGVVIKIVSKYMSNKHAYITFTIIMIVGFSIILIRHPYIPWIAIVPLALGISVSYSIFLGMFSNSMPKDQQGSAMGMIASISALSAGVAALAIGWLNAISIYMPIILALVFAIVSVGMMSFYDEQHQFMVE